MPLVTKNGLIVELPCLILFGGLLIFSLTAFRSGMVQMSSVDTGWCNVTQIHWRRNTCKSTGETQQLPYVSGYFVKNASKEDWKRYRDYSPLLHSRLCWGLHFDTVDSNAFVNLTQWEAVFYTKMSYNLSSPRDLYPYGDWATEANCHGYKDIYTALEHLERKFKWLVSYTLYDNNSIRMGYRICKMDGVRNRIIYDEAGVYLGIYDLLIIPFVLLFILGTLSVGPVTRRGDEPFRTMCLPLWWLILAFWFVIHATLWLVSKIICVVCIDKKKDLCETFRAGSGFCCFVKWYTEFEAQNLQEEAAPVPPQNNTTANNTQNEDTQLDLPTPSTTPPRLPPHHDPSTTPPSFVQPPAGGSLSPSAPPSYSLSTNDGLVIGNIFPIDRGVLDPTDHIADLPLPSYEDIMSGTFERDL